MIKTKYDRKHNAVVIEFEGHVDTTQGEQFFKDIQKVVPKHGKGFTLLTDMTSLDKMDLQVKDAITKAMDLFNDNGITRVLRVIPDDDKDIGFNILSAFHYSKGVKILTLQSREEALERLVRS